MRRGGWVCACIVGSNVDSPPLPSVELANWEGQMVWTFPSTDNPQTNQVLLGPPQPNRCIRLSGNRSLLIVLFLNHESSLASSKLMNRIRNGCQHCRPRAKKAFEEACLKATVALPLLRCDEISFKKKTISLGTLYLPLTSKLPQKCRNL